MPPAPGLPGGQGAYGGAVQFGAVQSQPALLKRRKLTKDEKATRKLARTPEEQSRIDAHMTSIRAKAVEARKAKASAARLIASSSTVVDPQLGNAGGAPAAVVTPSPQTPVRSPLSAAKVSATVMGLLWHFHHRSFARMRRHCMLLWHSSWLPRLRMTPSHCLRMGCSLL